MQELDLSVDGIKKFWEGPPSDAFPEFYKQVRLLLDRIRELEANQTYYNSEEPSGE